MGGSEGEKDYRNSEEVKNKNNSVLTRPLRALE